MQSQVRIITYDTSKDESPEILEAILSKIHSEPDKFEIISFDKSITQIGSFVCVLIYKELPDETELVDDFEIVVDENGDIIGDAESESESAELDNIIIASPGVDFI